LTDAAVVLVHHASELLQRAEHAEAELAAAAGAASGRVRIAAFQSVAIHIAAPVLAALRHDAPDLRCELIEAEPEQSLPALALGDVDLVLADEWHQPLSRPSGVERIDLHRDPLQVILPEDHEASRRRTRTVALRDLADEIWTTGHPGTPWAELTKAACRSLGGFDPDVRYRTNDSVLSLGLVARGLAVTLLPELVSRGAGAGVVSRALAGGSVYRTIFAATRAAHARRPSVRALLAAVRGAARDLGWDAGTA
jgi:DNA-binding transcriptional LysR family regulator